MNTDCPSTDYFEIGRINVSWIFLTLKSMLYNVRLLILFLGIASGIFLLLGLIRPWAMLWWEHTQNRKKVIALYGTLTVIFFLIYYVLKFFR